jgi:tellurite resistance protein TerC
MLIHLFPIGDYWWFYAIFTIFILFLLAFDLGVFHRHPHAVSFKEAAAWSAVWVTLALCFNALLYLYVLWKFPHDPRLLAVAGFDPQAAAHRTALEFLAGYIVEYSLSVDNIFVFVVVLRYFGIPSRLQHRVLFFGILGALIFRGLFIAAGSVLMQFQPVIWLFGAFLIFTGVRIAFGPEKEIHPERNPIIRLFQKYIPVTAELHGHRFFVKTSRVWRATPLFVTLLFVEMTDILFAVDSVPAIFALTSEPLIVFTSNVFAILGLRSMYFMLASAMDKFHMLKYGLAMVLVFVGLKMVWLDHMAGGRFSIGLSLAFICTAIACTVTLSILFPQKK